MADPLQAQASALATTNDNTVDLDYLYNLSRLPASAEQILSELVPIAPSDTILGHTSPEEAWQRQASHTQALLGLQGAAYPLFPSLSNLSCILVAKLAIVPILIILYINCFPFTYNKLLK